MIKYNPPISFDIHYSEASIWIGFLLAGITLINPPGSDISAFL
jgi:hypothetical protein